MNKKPKPTREEKLDILHREFRQASSFSILTALTAVFIMCSMGDGEPFDLDVNSEAIVKNIVAKNPLENPEKAMMTARALTTHGENAMSFFCLAYSCMSFGMMEYRRRRYNKALENPDTITL